MNKYTNYSSISRKYSIKSIGLPPYGRQFHTGCPRLGPNHMFHISIGEWARSAVSWSAPQHLSMSRIMAPEPP